MDGYSISQVAQRSGFPASTLRFYEQSGLVSPDRTPAGYRSYGDEHIELLAFIGRAKGFGLALDEITELLALLDEDECAPVQGRLKDLVDAKIADAHARMAELASFTAELRRVAATLDRHTPDGPCDDDCGCIADATPGWTGIALTAQDPSAADAPVACTLDREIVRDRLDQWHATVAAAESCERIDDGVRIRFGREIDIASVAPLAAAEQDCCRFFTFTLTLDATGVLLDITAPPEGRPLIDDLLGVEP